MLHCSLEQLKSTFSTSFLCILNASADKLFEHLWTHNNVQYSSLFASCFSFYFNFQQNRSSPNIDVCEKLAGMLENSLKTIYCKNRANRAYETFFLFTNLFYSQKAIYRSLVCEKRSLFDHFKVLNKMVVSMQNLINKRDFTSWWQTIKSFRSSS